MTHEPWTIDRIHDTLGNPALASRFLSEINRAPAHELLAVFARWERVAKDLIAAVERARDLAAHETRGEDLPGDWIDVTDKIRDEAANLPGRGAAQSNCQDLWISCGGSRCEGLVSFDEEAVLEAGTGSDEGDKVRCGDRSPAGLG